MIGSIYLAFLWRSEGAHCDLELSVGWGASGIFCGFWTYHHRDLSFRRAHSDLDVTGFEVETGSSRPLIKSKSPSSGRLAETSMSCQALDYVAGSGPHWIQTPEKNWFAPLTGGVLCPALAPAIATCAITKLSRGPESQSFFVPRQAAWETKAAKAHSYIYIYHINFYHYNS